MEILKSETFWVAFGAVITGLALTYTILINRLNKKIEIRNIKKALVFEIMTNIRTLFCGEVERPSLFDVITLIRTKYAQEITNQNIFWKIQKLYIELEYYRTFVNNVYLKAHIPDGGVYVTEKQLQTCNIFLEYFGENPVEFDLSERLEWNKSHLEREYMDFKRDKAIEIKVRKIEWWKTKIEKDIDLLFK